MEQAKRSAICDLRRAPHSPAFIAKLLKFYRGTVYSVYERFDESGDDQRTKHKTRKYKILTPSFLADLKRSVKTNPTATLTALAKKRAVSIMTIQRGLKQLAYVKEKIKTETPPKAPNPMSEVPNGELAQITVKEELFNRPQESQSEDVQYDATSPGHAMPNSLYRVDQTSANGGLVGCKVLLTDSKTGTCSPELASPSIFFKYEREDVTRTEHPIVDYHLKKKGDCATPSRRYASPTSPTRLTARHFPSLTPMRKANSKRTSLRCRVCSSKGKRKETSYMCRECDVGLCVVPCFEAYHTKVDFSK